jgi:ribosomal protein S18 acetylase RimI-like enzyme
MTVPVGDAPFNPATATTYGIQAVPARALASAPLPGALELQQICVLSDWHGLRVADRLMSWALATSASDPAPEVYLTVFDHNERAKPRWLVG